MCLQLENRLHSRDALVPQFSNSRRAHCFAIRGGVYIYDRISKTPVLTPSVGDIEMFYGTIHYLRGVTDTDDPNYASYMREFCRFIVAATKRTED